MKITKTDKMIMQLLRENSRRSLTEIAGIVELSRPTVRQRIEKLVDAGVIRRFTVELDHSDENRPNGVRAMFDVRLRRNVCGLVYASIQHWSELVSCWSCSGSVDMRVLIEAADQSIVEDLRDRLSRHPDVETLNTSMILKTWCERISGIEETVPQGYVITRTAEIA